jgi:hypothetical protein
MIRSIRNALGAALVVATTMTGTAWATTLSPMSVEQFTDASSYIVRGQVIGASWTTLDDAGRVFTHTTVRVDELLKGKESADEVVVTTSGGSYGAIKQYVPAEATFSDGEKVFLFLHQATSGRLYPISKFQGKLTERRAPGERRHYGVRWHNDEVTTFDHRFLPHPIASERVYIDELVGQVQNRLDKGWDGKAIPGMTNVELERVNTQDWRSPR